MLPKLRAIAAFTLPLSGVMLFSTPASAQFFFGGLGIGIGGGGRWPHYNRGGVFFGISPTIVIPSAPAPAYTPLPPDCRIQRSVNNEAPPEVELRPVFVEGHWEHLSDGQQRWVPDHYECR